MSALSQLNKLDALIRAAERARIAAEHGYLFADRKGLALCNAAFELFECGQLYDIARDIERECGMYSEAAE